MTHPWLTDIHTVLHDCADTHAVHLLVTAASLLTVDADQDRRYTEMDLADLAAIAQNMIDESSHTGGIVIDTHHTSAAAGSVNKDRFAEQENLKVSDPA